MGKAQKDYTIHNVIQNVPKFIRDKLDNATRPAFDTNLAYLDNIANAMSYNKLASKSFTETFSDKPFYEYLPQEINKVLAQCLQSQQAELDSTIAVEPQHQVLDKYLENSLFKHKTDDIKRHIDALKGNVNAHISDIESYSTYIQEKIQGKAMLQEEIDRKQIILDSLDKDSRNKVVIDAIAEVIDTKKWLYIGTFDNDQPVSTIRKGPYVKNDGGGDPTCRTFQDSTTWGHIFISTEPVVCAHINYADGINKRANFGHVWVAMRSNGSLNRAGFGLDAICSAGMSQHPHISSDGAVCWGNASSQLSNLVSSTKPNFVGVLDLFMSLMETYSPDNPYNTINSYLDSKIVKRHACLLPVELMANLPEQVLGKFVSKDVFEQIQEENKFRLRVENYLHEHARVQNRVSFDTVPTTLVDKLISMGNRYRVSFEASAEKYSNCLDHSEILEFIQDNGFGLTDDEWNSLINVRMESMNIEVRSLLCVLNYVRLFEQGKELIQRRGGSLQRCYRFHTDTSENCLHTYDTWSFKMELVANLLFDDCHTNLISKDRSFTTRFLPQPEWLSTEEQV